MENIKLTANNRAFVDEVGHIVSVLTKCHMECVDSNVITGGKAQALHCDWDSAQADLRWTKVVVVLYFPAGGGYINAEGKDNCEGEQHEVSAPHPRSAS